jgi:hypothetical protein
VGSVIPLLSFDLGTGRIRKNVELASETRQIYIYSISLRKSEFDYMNTMVTEEYPPIPRSGLVQ